MRHLFTVGEVAQVHVNWLLSPCANIYNLSTGEKGSIIPYKNHTAVTMQKSLLPSKSM